jgi:Collagen triple helix repeat (20 copies)
VVLLPVLNGTASSSAPNAVYGSWAQIPADQLFLNLLNERTATTGEAGRRLLESHVVSLSYLEVIRVSMIIPPGFAAGNLSQADSHSPIPGHHMDPQAPYPASEFARLPRAVIRSRNAEDYNRTLVLVYDDWLLADWVSEYAELLGSEIVQEFGDRLDQVIPQCAVFLCALLFEDHIKVRSEQPAMLLDPLEAGDFSMIYDKLTVISQFARDNPTSANKSWPTLLKSQTFFEGHTGPTGPSGDKGDTGDIGETGPTGAQGIQGPPGDAAISGINYRGVWAAGTYHQNDCVTAPNGSAYVCIVATTTQEGELSCRPRYYSRFNEFAQDGGQLNRAGSLDTVLAVADYLHTTDPLLTNPAILPPSLAAQRLYPPGSGQGGHLWSRMLAEVLWATVYSAGAYLRGTMKYHQPNSIFKP